MVIAPLFPYFPSLFIIKSSLLYQVRGTFLSSMFCLLQPRTQGLIPAPASPRLHLVRAEYLLCARISTNPFQPSARTFLWFSWTCDSDIAKDTVADKMKTNNNDETITSPHDQDMKSVENKQKGGKQLVTEDNENSSKGTDYIFSSL